MEEDGGAKAPVTRLRRRLSVELSEDSKSPAGSLTPTKKRGGRLAAKPQLELIDENTPQNSPKKMTRRRSTARDLEVEEKPLTPSRRSTRIKSNTSILSDTPQAVDSPRAKRALRRNSQIGSDSETLTPVTPAHTRRARIESTTSLDKQATATSADVTPVTPARIRRTRKDSASSVDKPAENKEACKTALIPEVIAEEQEYNLRKSVTHEDSDKSKIEGSPNSIRQSPRLKAKKNRNSTSKNEQNESLIQETDVNMNVSAGKSKLDNTFTESSDNKIALESKQEDVVDGTPQARLSLSSANDLNNLDKNPNKKPNMNKSTPSLLQVPSVIKTKRHRTKSWTTLATSSPKEGSFYSDNESTKEKINNNKFSLRLSNQTGSGDSAFNDIEKSNQSLQGQQENTKDKSLNNSLKKKRRSQNHKSESDKSIKESIVNQLNNINKSAQSPKPLKDKPEGNKENLEELTTKNTAEFLFKKAPSSIVQSTLFIEDSDSNTESLGKTNKNTEIENEDQRVPEVEKDKNHKSQKSSESCIFNLPTEKQLFSSLPTANNDTCEPMDIDETMPENISLNDHSGENQSVNDSQNKSSRKSSLISSSSGTHITSVCVPEDDSAYKRINKSKRKSLSNSMSQDNEKIENDNRSTLILSEIKDLSTGDHNTSKTSNYSKQGNELLSKSITLIEEDKNNRIVNKNISLSCLTSTPVQQKDDKKNIPVQMNTSAITPHSESKKVFLENKICSNTINIPMASRSLQSTSSDEELVDNERNNLVIDEVEDAGEDYESGDSRDEEEREYEKEHEILDKGVTLTSEDEVSNDTDYEKDSFIVSSDTEDNELLSGSGDDLELSDNELTMSAKSKKKYNERLSNQQKRASREMYQARHGLDKSDQNSGSKVKKYYRLRLDSTLLKSGDDAVVPPKKKKRMRLESTIDSSVAKSDAEESKFEPKETLVVEDIRVKKNKSKRLSESVSETGNEKEVSVSNYQNDVQDKSVSEEIGYIKKKTKQLSESICNESVMDEKEITAFCDTSIVDDPLKVQIKQEPKTPQRELDISTIHFTVREQIEQVQVDDNFSVMKGNETSDPLLDTMAQDEDNDDSDDENFSLSENEEITKSYDSVLTKLNKDTNQKIKSVDISLDLNKKERTGKKPSIIDQLNITQTKKTKSNKKAEVKESKPIFKRTASPDDEATSDSGDMKLLFSDESNDGVEVSSALQNNTETVEEFIPLKRTEDKTNLSGSVNASQIPANDTSLNTSSKKKSKCKSIQKEKTTDDTEEQTMPFFIDTVGSHDEPLNNSASTMKNKNNKINTIIVNGDCEVGTEDKYKDVDSDNDAPAEVSYTCLKNNNKSKKVSLSVEEDTAKKTIANHDKPSNRISINKTLSRENKKKQTDDQDGKSGEQLPLIEIHNKSQDNLKADMEISSGVSNKKVNKKRKRSSSAKNEVDNGILKGDIPTTNVLNQTNESLVSNSKKKRKLVYNSENIAILGPSGNHIFENIDKSQSDKKHKPSEGNQNKSVEKSRKRKERDDDVHDKKSKVLKQNSSEKKRVPRLPTTILEELEDKPKKRFIEAKVVSTAQFKVEGTRKRRNKPSNFLEESIYLNNDSESPNVKKQKFKVKKPTVLPFTPTASTSDSGFTTKFHITPIPQKIEFVAQKTETINFKTDYLKAQRSKKLRTYELYKNHRNVKLSKY